MLLFLVACGGGEPKEELQRDLSGDELLESYNTAICDLYEEESCGQVLGACGDAVPNYSDWAHCMNEQSSYTSCNNIPGLLYDDYATAAECIESLTDAECSTEDLCLEDGNILQAGACGEIVSMIHENCGLYGLP
jgi:hypothetical protein